jgi:hypothetical protein
MHLNAKECMEHFIPFGVIINPLSIKSSKTFFVGVLLKSIYFQSSIPNAQQHSL